MKCRIHFSILLLISQFLFGQNSPVILNGQVGKYPIIMEITIYDSSCDIRYFYTNQGKDIRLTGTVATNNKIIVNSDDQADTTVTKEQFELNKIANGYEGAWTSGNKKLQVLLKETSAEAYKNLYEELPGINELKEDDPYSFIRISGFIFEKRPDSVYSEFEWYKEKYSGMIMPSLKKGYSSAIIKKINASLLERHLIESNNYLDCLGNSFGEYDLSIDYFFISKNVFSIDLSTGFDCGGAHPGSSSEGLNFDGRTGDLLKLDEIFWFNNTKPPEEDSDPWYDYRDSIFAPKVMELLKTLYPEEMKSPGKNDEDQCDYTDTEVWNFPNWYFTDKGLYLGATFGGASRVCDSPGWSVIPYKYLKPYLNPKTKFRLPEK